MNKSNLKDRIVLVKKITIDLFIIALVTFSLLLITDHLISVIFPQTIVNLYGEGGTLRTKELQYHHGLRGSRDLLVTWGGQYTNRICTDNNAFKYTCNRNRGKDFDVLFIGDSFTEGVGVEYENTFVGLYENAMQNLSIANAAVVSYSPSIYYTKIKKLLDDGYNIKNVVVFIDISDIQDEAINYKIVDGYVLDANNNGGVGTTKLNAIFNFALYKIKEWFPITYNMNDNWKKIFTEKIMTQKDYKENPTKKYGAHEFPRAEWTYNINSTAYGKEGALGGIKSSLSAMNKLYALLNTNNISLSVAVYPWPMQLMYDKSENLQVKTWRGFCENKCKYFIELNSVFFNEIQKSSTETVIGTYYMEGDVHFNNYGHELVSKELIKKLKF